MTKDIILAAIFAAVSIGLAICVSEPAITFKPFSLSVRAWYKGALWLLLMAGYAIVTIGWRFEYYRGVKDGISKTLDYVIEQSNKQKEAEQ